MYPQRASLSANSADDDDDRYQLRNGERVATRDLYFEGVVRMHACLSP